MLRAVHHAVQHELAAHSGDDRARAHLLSVADVLLHRAVLEDVTAERRSAVRGDLEAFARDASAGAATSPDPFAVLEGVAEQLARGSVPASLVHDVIRRLVEADLPELGRSSTPEQEAAATAAMDSLGGEVPATVSQQVVEDYLAARRGASSPLSVRAVTQLTGGFSKTTLLVALEVDGQREEVVLRQVGPGRESTSLAAEYDVLRYAYRNGVPAPEPLWIEVENTALGGPFFATRRVRGSNVGDVFGPRPGTPPDAALDLARALAAVHQLDPAGVGTTPVPPMASRAEILERIGEQEQKVTRVAAAEGTHARPLHALLFAWLRVHVPADGFPAVLLHGDPGFHNLLVHQGEVQAMLDWERSLVGDPAQDLSYVRPHVLRVLPWEQFLDAYCAAGGTAPDEQRLSYYAVWHDVWRFAGAYRGRARLLAESGAMVDAVTGLLHAPRFLLSALRTAFEVDL